MDLNEVDLNLAKKGMSKEGVSKLSQYMAHGYKIEPTSSLTLLTRGEKALVIDKNGKTWIAKPAI